MPFRKGMRHAAARDRALTAQVAKTAALAREDLVRVQHTLSENVNQRRQQNREPEPRTPNREPRTVNPTVNREP